MLSSLSCLDGSHYDFCFCRFDVHKSIVIVDQDWWRKPTVTTCCGFVRHPLSGSTSTEQIFVLKLCLWEVTVDVRKRCLFTALLGFRNVFGTTDGVIWPTGIGSMILIIGIVGMLMLMFTLLTSETILHNSTRQAWGHPSRTGQKFISRMLPYEQTVGLEKKSRLWNKFAKVVFSPERSVPHALRWKTCCSYRVHQHL